MNDFKTLFGGFAGGVALLALYIFAWGAMQKCFGAEVRELAPDGVNVITSQVVDGRVESAATTTAYVPPRYYPQSGEVVVIGDAPYVMVSLADWERWTNAVARLEVVAARRWKNEHATDAGRRAWHGAVVKTELSEDGAEKVTTYADGYRWTERATPQRRVPAAVKAQRAADAKRAAPPVARAQRAVPARLRAKREAMAARPAVQEVNATFGAGGKVLKVEEAK